MNEHEFREWLRTRSPGVQNLNKTSNSRMPNQRKSLDQVQVGEEQRNETLGAQYKLVSCKIDYWCAHGKELDEDNATFSASKPIADSVVNIGIARDDKDFKTQAAQRMDKNYSDI